MKPALVFNILFLLFFSNLAIATEFDDYPSNENSVTEIVKPDVFEAKAHKFRTLLTRESTLGANFNGHFRIVTWGCGTACAEWGIINLKSGGVWFPNTVHLSVCMPDEGNEEKYKEDYIVSSKNSSLFYVYDCANEGPGYKFYYNTKYIYLWKNGEPTLLRKERIE